jgi:hypothetical protein
MNPRLVACLFVKVLLIVSSSCGQEKATASSEIRLSVPFQLTSGFLITIKGRIGPLDDLQFILDTGVITSVVDRRVADQLHIPRHVDQVFSFQKYVKVERAEFPEVRCGPVIVKDASMFVADLSKISEFSGHADVIIGMDLLSLSKKLRIDYDSRMVVFVDPDAGIVVSPRRPQGLTTLLVVQGRPMRLLIDTGLEGILLYENRLRARVPDLRLEGRTKNARVGWMTARTTTLRGVELNNPDSSVEVLLADGPIQDVMPGVDGYLGVASLKARLVEFDLENHVLRWRTQLD